MSSFTLHPVAVGVNRATTDATASTATNAAATMTAATTDPARRGLPVKPQLLHRLSDPLLIEQDLDDVVDMSEHVRWANLGEPIYAEKDVEIFRPAPLQSTLATYFVKAWLPYAADTVFNALMDAQYRCVWDASNTKQLSVVEHRTDGDVMYCTQRLPWPLAMRDYVYHRRAKFYTAHQAFVVVCQAMHHARAPATATPSGCVRVETYALRLCIRSTGTSSCDIYVEYEDDTDFSVPDCVVRWLVASNVPTFFASLRAACANYAHYTRTRSCNELMDAIPSEVVRAKSEVAAAMSKSCGLASHGAESVTSQRSSDASARSASSNVLAPLRTRLRQRGAKQSTHSDDESTASGSNAAVETTRTSAKLRWSLLRTKTTSSSSSSRKLKKTASTGSLHELVQSPTSSISSSSLLSPSEPVVPISKASKASSPQHADVVLAFHKQHVGLHLEADVASNKLLVAYCEPDSEAAQCASTCAIVRGMLVTSVNGNAVARMSFNDAQQAIKTTLRPLTLGFTHAAHATAATKAYRRFKEPKNVVKCVVAPNERDLVRALRPLDERAAVSAVLKTDFVAPLLAKKPRRLRASITTRASVSGASTNANANNADDSLVVVPEGFLVHEIDNCFVGDLPFAEIAHLLHRNSEPRVVTFKAALAVEGDRVAQHAARSELSKRLSGVFRWRSDSMLDELSAATIRSANSSPFANATRGFTDRNSNTLERSAVSAAAPTPTPTALPAPLQRSDDTSESKWTDAVSPGACLADYADVTITASNLKWVWEHVHLLKADERVFSAALLVHKLETYLMRDGVTCAASIAASNAMLTAMHDERAFVARIKDRSDQGRAALHEFNGENDADWQFGQTYVGVTTHWKPGVDGTVWLKLDGLVEGVDIFHTIAVIRETDLYSVWVPFCNRSELLQQTGHVDIVAYMSIAFPLLQRDAIIKAFGINACYESRAILLLGATERESTLPQSIKVPKLRGWNADRMEMRGFRALIEPITRTKARVCIVANIDPKCPVPRSLLNFGIKKAAGILLYLIRKEAEKIEQAQRDGGTSDTVENEHLRRIERDPTHFYGWLAPLMDKWFADMSCNALPPPMALPGGSSSNDSGSSDKSVDATAAAATGRQDTAALPRKTSRTATFYRHHTHDGAAVDAPTDGSLLDTIHQNDSSAVAGGRQRQLVDYLYDFGIWPYALMFLFSHVSPTTSFLHVCALKFVFTCTCTWFGVPGAFSWQTRRLKRARQELNPLRRRCVVLAGLCDVLNSWFLRVWVHWLVCYLPTFVHQVVLLVAHQEKLQQQLEQHGRAGCFDRSPLEVRESENVWLIGSAFLFASAVVAIQIVVNI